MKCGLSTIESYSIEKNGSKFSHLLTVRAKGAPPPPYGQPDRKISFFFCWCLPLYWKFEIVHPTKGAKKLCFLKLGDFWYLRHTDIGSNKAFISLNHFPKNISFKLHILCPQQSQVSRSKVRTLKEVFPLLFLLNLPGIRSPIQVIKIQISLQICLSHCNSCSAYWSPTKYLSFKILLKCKFPDKYLTPTAIPGPRAGFQISVVTNVYHISQILWQWRF